MTCLFTNMNKYMKFIKRKGYRLTNILENAVLLTGPLLVD